MRSATLVPRVAARHVRRADLVQHDVPENIEIVLKDVPHRESVEVLYSDGGVVTTADLARLLEGRVGRLTDVRFSFALPGQHAVRWKSRDEHGHVVSGWLVLHAGVRGDEAVVSWAEITIDQRGEDDARTAHVQRGNAERRLAEVGRMARGLLRDLSNQTLALVDAAVRLVGIVDVAEADIDDAEQPAQGKHAGSRYDRRSGLDAEDVGVLQRRLERIAERGRELLLRARSEPTFGHAQILKAVARIVAEAERDQ